MNLNFSKRTRYWLDTLVSFESQSGGNGEKEFAKKLEKLLLEDQFLKNARIWRQEAWENGAENLFVYIEGTGRKTVLLTGHYDTVTIANYGNLKDFALKPTELLDKLVISLEEELEKTKNSSLEFALNDLKTGDFMVGRGSLDMKSGLAAGLAVIEQFSLDPVGNLLLVFSPDEEDSSKGARAARLEIAGFVQEKNLEIELAINLDASSDQGDGSNGRCVYFGTVGKLLPFTFFVGRDTHAGFPFEGISAHAMNAEMISRTELNINLTDEAYGEKSVPPVCLESRDFRTKYDVTTPKRVWSVYNILSHKRNPKEVLEIFKNNAKEAMNTVLEKHSVYTKSFGYVFPDVDPVVLTIKELRKEVLQSEENILEYEKVIKSLESETNPLIASAFVCNWLLDRSSRVGPFAVVGFGSLFYPHTHILNSNVSDKVKQAIDHTSKKFNLKQKQFFAGISDMSFIGVNVLEDNIQAVANLAAPTKSFADKNQNYLIYPTVNIGPWGRDYHQWLERLYLPDALNLLPNSVWFLVHQVLED